MNAASTVRLRPMDSADIASVMAVERSLASAPHWPREAYERAADAAARPVRLSWIAENTAAELVGFIVVSLVVPEADLESIAVAATAQKQGIGKLLLNRITKELLKNRITEVMLEVRESNLQARAFYLSAGFGEVGRRAAYYADPKEDALIMRRLLI